jgi:hypothetical protein
MRPGPQPLPGRHRERLPGDGSTRVNTVRSRRFRRPSGVARSAIGGVLQPRTSIHSSMTIAAATKGALRARSDGGGRGCKLNRGRLRSPESLPTFPTMDRDYWTEKLRDAEAELEAATTLTAVKAAAKKLQRARTLAGQPARTSSHSSTTIAEATNSAATQKYRRRPRIVGQPLLHHRISPTAGNPKGSSGTKKASRSPPIACWGPRGSGGGRHLEPAEEVLKDKHDCGEVRMSPG